jgi:hypothetical protein
VPSTLDGASLTKRLRTLIVVRRMIEAGCS